MKEHNIVEFYIIGEVEIEYESEIYAWGHCETIDFDGIPHQGAYIKNPNVGKPYKRLNPKSYSRIKPQFIGSYEIIKERFDKYYINNFL